MMVNLIYRCIYSHNCIHNIGILCTFFFTFNVDTVSGSGWATAYSSPFFMSVERTLDYYTTG